MLLPQSFLTTFALLLVGCTRLNSNTPERSTRTIAVCYEQDVSRTAVDATKRAADAWTQVSDGIVSVDVRRSDVASCDAMIETVHPSVALHAKDGSPSCGYVVENKRMYLVESPACNYEATALHEVGHLIGIQAHLVDPGHVMSEVSGSLYLTAADEWLCEREGLCAERF